MAGALPRRIDSVGAQWRMDRRASLACVLAVIGAGTLIGLARVGHQADPFALAFGALLCIAGAILLRPISGVYLIVFFTILADTSTMNWYPFSANFSSSQSILYVHNRLTFSPLEVCIALTFVSWLIHASDARQWRLVGWPLIGPVLLFGAFIVFGLVYGLVLGGGDQTAAFWEFRPLVYLVAVYVLASNLLTRVGHYVLLAWTVVAATFLQSLLALGYYAGLPTATRSTLESLTDHPASLVYGWLLLLTLAVWILRGCSRRARILLTVACIPTTWVFVLSQRRAAMVALLTGFIVFALVLFFRRRKAFLIVVPIAVLLVTGYTAAFWNASSGVGFGAQAIKSVIAPGAVTERNQASDLYRIIENYDLSYTVRAEPLTGVGFGKPFYRPAPLPDISFFIFYEYIPHNSIVWIWLKMGYLGFVSFLFLLAVALRAGTRASLQMPTGDALAVTVAGLAGVVMFVVFAFVDIAFIPQASVFLAVCLAICSNVTRVAESDGEVLESGGRPEDTGRRQAVRRRVPLPQ